MKTATPRSSTWRKAVGGAAALALATAISSPAAQAAPEPVNTPVTGKINLPDAVLDLSSGVFDGTFDAETGELAGTFSFPVGQSAVTYPGPGTITYQISQPAPGTGTVDLETGDATFSADLILSLLSLQVTTITSQVFQCSYTIPLELTGTYDADAGELTLTQEGLETAVIPAGMLHCMPYGGELLDPVIVGTENSVTAVVGLSVPDAVAPEPAPTPAPAPGPAPAPEPAPAPAPTPVVQQPTFTG